VVELVQAASTPDHYTVFGKMIREYVEWVRARYSDYEWIVDIAFDHRSFDEELRNLSTLYGPPKGKTLLAWRDGDLVGAGAYRRLSDEVCEMKRLFVPARYQGAGTGRRLCNALLRTAKIDGFRVMRLDTGHLFAEAIKLYQSVGFHSCAAYNDYPSALQSYMVYMERDL